MTHVGVIEWASDQGSAPEVFISSNRDAVVKAVTDRLSQPGVWFIDDQDFLKDNPRPDVNDVDACLAWLAEMHEATTAPWLTMCEEEPLDGTEVYE